jgi:protein-tyrosine phosphatase
MGAMERARLLPLVGAFNFRDLGGYPVAGGGATRWDRLYRSDTLHELTEGDIETLADVGLRTVIDLRTPEEVSRNGRGRLARSGAEYLNLSVLPTEGGESIAAPAPEAGMSERYLWYLEVGAGALVRAFEALADERSYPVVFHCTAGKDRTGVLASLVLEACGVDRDAIVTDYVLTEERLDLILERLRRDPHVGPRLENVARSRLAVEASAMEGFLGGLDGRFGGLRGWATRAGLDGAVLDQIVRLLVEPVARPAPEK